MLLGLEGVVMIMWSASLVSNLISKDSIATVTVATPCDKLVLICRTILFPEYFTLGVGKKKEPGYEALCRTS